MNSEHFMHIGLCLLLLARADNESVAAGNLSTGGTTDGRGNLIGAKSIYHDDGRFHQNLDILKGAFDRSFSGQEISDEQRGKMKEVVSLAAHGHAETIMELIQRFILTPVEGRTLQENAQEHGHREPHTHFQEHFEYEPFPSRDGDGSNENREELTETGELGELGESGRSDELGEYGTTHSTTHSTTHNHPIHPLEESHRIPAGSNTSLNSGQKTGPVAPDAPFTKKVDGKERPGPTEEDHEKKAEQMGKMDEFVTGMGQGAYDRSMERGLLPEEAEANRAAAQSYARAYEEYKMDGLSPEEADQRARSIFKDMNSIAPNGADLFSDLNTLTIINESRESVPSGTLGERYPSAMLESEAAHARDREVKEVEKRKDAANLVSHALERDSALKNRIQEEMAAVVEKLRALRRMKADTIESRVDSNNNSPGEIEDPAVKERLKTVRETYGQMVAESQAPPRRRSLKDLTMQNEKDEKMAEENRRVYTEHVEGRRAAAAAQEQRAAETAERIEKEEAEEGEAVERAIPGGYDNEAVNRTLSESAEQKANEQAEAQEQIDEVVATAGETAYQNVMSLGGSVEEAEKSQTEAARLKTDQIKEEMDQRVDEIKEQLGEQMDPQTAESMARHIVTVHELKEVLKTIERGGSVDTSSNTISSNSNTTTNTSNTTNITNNVTIISATPDDEGTVSLEHVVLTLPLPADAEPTPRTEADQQNEEIVEERRETYRNTRVDTGGKPFYTGLPELVGEDGSITILSEGLHKIIVGKGRIEMDENTVEQMRREGMDVSPFKAIITEEGTVYAMELVDAVVGLGSDGERSAPTVTVGEETISLGGHSAKVVVTEGAADQTPFSELRNYQRPVVKKNAEASDLDDNDPVEAELIEAYKEIDRKQGEAEQIRVDVFKNRDNGRTIVKQEPLYGTTQVQSMEQAKKEAIGRSSLNEIATEEKTVVFDMQELPEKNSPDVGVFLAEAAKSLGTAGVAENRPFVRVEEKGARDTLTTHLRVPETTETAIQQAVNRQAAYGNTSNRTETETMRIVGRPRSSSTSQTTTTTTHSPLNSMNPVTGEVNSEMEAQTGQFSTVNTMIADSLRPERNEADKIVNDLMRSTTTISERTGVPVMDLFETISHINTQTVVELIDGFREHRPQKQINRIIETITTYMPPAYSEEITTYIVDRAADAAGVPSPNGQIVHKEAVGRTATVTGPNGEKQTVTGPNGEKQTVTGEPGTSRIVQKVRTDGVPTVTAPSSEPTPQFNATNPRIMEPQPFTPNPNINRKPGGSGGSSPLGGNNGSSPLGGNGNTSPLGGNNQTGGNGNNPLGGNTGNTGNNQTSGNPLGGYSPLGGNNSNSNSNPTGSNGGNSSNSNPNTTTNNDNDNDNAGSGEIPLNYLAP